MIVAACAADAQPEKRLTDVHDHLIDRILACESNGGRILADLARQQHGGGDEKARRLIHAQRITSDLLADELIVRQIGIEGTDDVVAVGPGVRALGVHFKTMRVRVAHHVQPVLRPALAVARRVQQRIHDALEGIAASVFGKSQCLLRCRRQPREIERNPAQPRYAICWR